MPRIALGGRLRPPGNAKAAGSLGGGGFVVPSGYLPDQFRSAPPPLASAFDAAEHHTQP